MAMVFQEMGEQAQTVEQFTVVVERRRSPRQATLLQVAKISGDDFEELCILRDISPEGLRAELYCDAHIGERVRFDLRNGERIAGHVVWAKDRSVGVEFDSPLPVLKALAFRSLDAKGRKVRPPRLNTEARGTLRFGRLSQPIRICDVSPGGARVRGDTMPDRGTACEIKLDGDVFRKACICWSKDGEAGLTLLPPMSYAEFADWRRLVAPRARFATRS